LEEPLDVRAALDSLNHLLAVKETLLLRSSPAEEALDELQLRLAAVLPVLVLLLRLLLSSAVASFHMRIPDQVQVRDPVQELVGNLEDVEQLIDGYGALLCGGGGPRLRHLVVECYEAHHVLDFILERELLVGKDEQEEEAVHVDVERVELSRDELAHSLDVKRVHLQDEEQLPLGHVHLALVAREVHKLFSGLEEDRVADGSQETKRWLRVLSGLLNTH